MSAFVLNVTSEQRAMVVGASQNVPPRWRERYMHAVADLLTGNPAPSNKDIIDACAAARRAISVGIGPPSLS